MSISHHGQCRSCNTTRPLLGPDAPYCSQRCQIRGPKFHHWMEVIVLAVFAIATIYFVYFR